MTNSQNIITPGTNTQLPQTWIFQANPGRYKIYESLADVKEELWNLRQHAKEVKIGDRVLLWISGAAAGIYAVGTVLTAPVLMPDSSVGQSKWTNEKDGQRIWPRVQVRYDWVLEYPLLKKIVQCDPDLWNHAIICAPRHTNFAVTQAEWLALKVWLDSM